MKIIYILAAALVIALSLFVAKTSFSSYPSSIVIVRHGEKSEGPNLTPIGWRRAEAFVSFFGASPDPATPAPFAIYAPQPTPDSTRPLQTVTPLAKALGLNVQTPFQLDQMKDLAELILTTKTNRGKEVLICYEHTRIPELVNELITQAGGKHLELAPYPDNRFDLIYHISYSKTAPKFATPYVTLQAGKRIFLTVTNQELLFNDPDKLPPPPFPLLQK